MFKIVSEESIKFDDLTEIYDEVSEDIKTLTDYSARYVVAAGPVLTGLFRGNWNVSIDAEYDGVFIHEDPSGRSTLAKMQVDIESFNIMNDKVMYIQNNVINLNSGEHYAETVGWDATGTKSESILNRAIIIGAERIN